jgi:hypothetical protein
MDQAQRSTAAQALVSAGARGVRIVVEASPAGEVTLMAQRWQRGDLCVVVLASVPLPAALDVPELAQAIVGLVEQLEEPAP